MSNRGSDYRGPGASARLGVRLARGGSPRGYRAGVSRISQVRVAGTRARGAGAKWANRQCVPATTPRRVAAARPDCRATDRATEFQRFRVRRRPAFTMRSLAMSPMQLHGERSTHSIPDSYLLVGLDETGHESPSPEGQPVFGIGGCAVPCPRLRACAQSPLADPQGGILRVSRYPASRCRPAQSDVRPVAGPGQVLSLRVFWTHRRLGLHSDHPRARPAGLPARRASGAR